MTSSEISRRALGGMTLAGVAVPLLAACGTDEPSPNATGSQTGGQGGSGGLVPTSDVPVGGGVVVEGADVVVTQPAEGTFKCFSAVCTHQGCLVTGVEGGEISCRCHGSVFSAEDGSVLDGPAEEPLEEFPVTVDGGEVTRT